MAAMLSCQCSTGLRPQQPRLPARQVRTRANEPNKTLREFSEETGKVIDNSKGEVKKQTQKVDPMSKEFKNKLRDEYTGFGGAPNKPMKNNFLIVGAVIAGFALLSKLAGYI